MTEVDQREVIPLSPMPRGDRATAQCPEAGPRLSTIVAVAAIWIGGRIQSHWKRLRGYRRATGLSPPAASHAARSVPVGVRRALVASIRAKAFNIDEPQSWSVDLPAIAKQVAVTVLLGLDASLRPSVADVALPTIEPVAVR